jgi:hypothetical protein
LSLWLVLLIHAFSKDIDPDRVTAATTMFVHYDGPSKKRSAKTQRAVNAFKAAKGASRSHGSSDPGRGTIQWMHVPEDESTGEKDASSKPDAAQLSQSQSQSLVGPATSAPLTNHLLGIEKFYHILGERAKGPLTTAALSHCAYRRFPFFTLQSVVR